MAPGAGGPAPPAAQDEDVAAEGTHAPLEEGRLGGSPAAKAANAAVLALTRAARSFTLYDPANKVVRSLIADYRDRFRAVLEGFGPLVLDAHPFELAVGREVVYFEQDRERSLSFRLFRDGVRKMAFAAETTWDELQKLLQVLSCCAPCPERSETPMRTVVPLALALVVLAGRPPAAPAGGAEGLEAWMLGPFVRRAGPVLGPRADAVFHCPVRNADVRWEAKDVFNPAAVVREGKMYLLYRAQDDVGRPAGTSRIGLAASDDGLAFERRPEPVLFPDDDFMMPYEWEGGCEDPRVVESEDGTYVMTYTAFDGTTARLAVATSRDLVRWTKHGLAFGKAAGGRFRDLWSKSGAVVAALQASGRIVAARIEGKYWMYWGDTDIFAATSDNLVDWAPVEREHAAVGKVPPPGDGRRRVETPGARTCFKVVVSTRHGRFDSALVEPGPPPLVDSRGILFLHNASNDRLNGDGTLPDRAYAGGQVLLDPADPAAVLARAKAPFLRPESAAESAGQVPNVTFLEGLVFFQGRWLLYYGMADSRIGVAEYRP